MVKLFHQVKPKGLSGNKVTVEYIDTETKQFLETEMTSDHEVPSREFIPKKHGSLQETIKELEKEYPDTTFYVNKYQGRRTFLDKEILILEDRVYSVKYDDLEYAETLNENYSYIIRARMKDRAQRKKLDFTFGPKKNPLFITNTEKSALARSKIYEDETEAQIAYNHNVTVLRETIPERDIVLKSKGNKHFIEIRTENKNIKFLDLNEFRIQRYESKQTKNIKEIEDLVKKLEEFKLPQNVDKFTVVELLDKRKTKQYKILISATNDFETEKELKEYGVFKKTTESGKSALLPRQVLQDPFNLNSPTVQLRNKFPIFTNFDPEKKLDEQINYEKTPIYFNSIEKKVEEIYQTFLENCCSIDLEVIDYNNDVPSGRIYMAILDSVHERKLYITKEAWRKNSWKEKTTSQLKNKKIELFFVENEAELVIKLNSDSQKYRFIIGHNILEYDFEHLTKFDKEKNKEIREKLEEIKKQQGIKKSQKIWDRTKQETLDTYPYSRNRITLLGDSKLSTIAGFDKSLSYKEIDEKIRSGKFSDFLEVCLYTIEDGEKSSKATNLLLKTAILESMLVNKPVNTVFNTDPVMLHYEAGDRNYEIMTGTYSKRHEQNFKRFAERLKNRKSITETTNALFKTIKFKTGKINGKLQYPSLLFDVFYETIQNNDVAKYIFESAKKENNIMIKENLLSIIEYYLQIPVDKARTYMEAKNLKFGETYEPERIYNFWNKTLEEALEMFKQKLTYQNGVIKGLKLDEEKIEFLSDEEFNQANIIFSMQYDTKFHTVRSAQGITLNTVIPDKSRLLKEKITYINKANITGKANTFLITENSFIQESIDFGYIKGIAYKDWFIGTIKAERDYEIYQNIKKPKLQIIKQAFQAFLQGKLLPIDQIRKEYFSLDKEEQKKLSEKQKTALTIMYDSDPFQIEPDLFSTFNL